MTRALCLVLLATVAYATEERAMAERHQTGDGVAKDQKQSIAWFERAAAKGDAAAMARLAKFYSMGLGVPRDTAKAKALYRKAAELGDAIGQLQVGLDLERTNAKESERWHRLAGEQGEIDGLIGVANFRAAANDQVEATRWYRRAAERGNPACQRIMGVRCQTGMGTKRDAQAALAWYRKAAAQGEREAQRMLGFLTKDRAWLEKAAAQGDPPALHELAKTAGPARRYTILARAVASSHRHAAAQKSALRQLQARRPAAQYELGRLYWFGFGVKRDRAKARALWRAAHGAGHRGAAARLGIAQRDRSLVAAAGDHPDAGLLLAQFAKGDERTAHLRRAADAGCLDADVALGALPNLVRAAAAGHPTALERLGGAFLTHDLDMIYEVAKLKRAGRGFTVDPLFERHLRRAAGAGHAGARALVGPDWRETAEEETFRRRVAAAHHLKAALRAKYGGYAAGAVHAEKAYRFYLWNNGREHALTETLANLIVLLHRKAGDPDRAAAFLGEYEPPLLLVSRAHTLAREGAPGQAAVLLERVLAKVDPRQSLAYTTLAASLYDGGLRYDDAARLHARAIARAEKELPPDHPGRRIVYRNYASHLNTRGQFEKAGPIRRKVYDLAAKAPLTDLDAIVDRLAEARTVLNAGRIPAAIVEDLRRRASAAGDKLRPFLHAELLLVEAQVAREQGRDAEALLEQALAVADTKETRARVRGMIARHLVQQGRAPEAAPHFAFAADAYVGKRGGYRVIAAGNRRLAAASYWAGGDIANALKQMRAAIETTDEVYDLLIQSGNDVQKHRQLTLAMSETDVLLSLNAAVPDNERVTYLALRTLFRRKGRVLDAATDTARLMREHATPETRELLEKLAVVRSARAALALGMATGTTKRERELERRELDLLRSLVRRGHRVQPAGVGSIRERIPEDAALIEIAAYHPFDPTATDWIMGGSDPQYIAYVVRRSGALKVVPLGDGAKVEAAVREFLHGLEHPSREVHAAARRLDELVMQPLRPHVHDVPHLLIAPDGRLNLIPFAALVDGEGGFVAARHTITYLTSGRDLLRLQRKTPAPGAPLLVGAPDYGGRGRFGPLPGTVEEVTAIAGILDGARVLQGAAAREKSLREARAPAILHIATHGFFDGAGSAVAGTRGLAPVERTKPKRLFAPLPKDIRNPLARSGLALAGANDATGGLDDGVLTALDVTLLDLWGTELVVLSACETGVGKVERTHAHFDLMRGVREARKRGSKNATDILRYSRMVATSLDRDGVYGLRRALVIAGSKSQVMSLWKVDDAATRDLMIAYYRALKGGMGRSAALRHVQLKMLADPKRKHPFYWAAFIASGEWAPLPR